MRSSCLLLPILVALTGCHEDLEPMPVVRDAVRFLSPQGPDSFDEPEVRVEGEARIAAGINWMEAVVNGERRVLPAPTGPTATFAFDARLHSGANRIEVRAYGMDDMVSESVEVFCTYGFPRIDEFFATPADHASDEPVTLAWRVSGAAPLRVELDGHGEVEPVGSLVVEPTTVTSYRLVATNAGGTVSAGIGTRLVPRMSPEIPTTGVGVRSYLQLDEPGTGPWVWNGDGVYDFGSSRAEWTAPAQTGTYQLTATEQTQRPRVIRRTVEVVDPPAPIGSLVMTGGQPGADHRHVVGNAAGDLLYVRRGTSLLWREAEQQWRPLQFDAAFEPHGESIGPEGTFLVYGWRDYVIELFQIDPHADEPIVRHLEMPFDAGRYNAPHVQLVGETIYLASRETGLPAYRLHSFTFGEEVWRETPALPRGMRALELAAFADGSVVVRAEAGAEHAFFRLDPTTFGWEELAVPASDTSLHGLADGSVLLVGPDLRRLATDGTTTVLASSLPEAGMRHLALHDGTLVALADTMVHRVEGGELVPWHPLPAAENGLGWPELRQIGTDRVFLVGTGLWELEDGGWARVGAAGLPASSIGALSVAADGALAVAVHGTAASRQSIGGVFLRQPGSSDFHVLPPPTGGAGALGAVWLFAWNDEGALALADSTSVFVSAPAGSTPALIAGELPAGPIYGLAAADDGWLVCMHSGVLQSVGGAGWEERAALHGLRSCAVDEEGTLWAATASRVYRLAGDAWEELPPLEQAWISDLAIADGVVWVAGAGVHRLVGPGWEAMGSGGCATDAEKLLPTGRGPVLCYGRGMMQWLDAESGAWARLSPHLDSNAPAVHRDGTLYIASEELGLVEARLQP